MTLKMVTEGNGLLMESVRDSLKNMFEICRFVGLFVVVFGFADL